MYVVYLTSVHDVKRLELEIIRLGAIEAIIIIFSDET